MRNVHAAAGARLRGQRHQFGGLGVRVGVVDECRSNAERSVFHRFTDELAHLGQLRGIRLDVVFAEDVRSNGTCADEGSNVRRNAAAFQFLEVLAECRPVDGLQRGIRSAQEVGLHGVVQRAHRRLAHHFQRHALTQVAEGALVDEQRLFRVGQHVDEARRYRLASGVELHRPRARGFRAYIDDAVSLQRDITNKRLGTATVIDRAVAKHGGVGDSRCLGYRGRGQGADQ